MSFISIVFKNLKKRSLSTVLTITSVVLGVAMIIAITVIQAETEKSFSQTSVGYDLILAAKGSQLQTTLNALYHLETSTGIIPYALYEIARQDPRVSKAFPLYVGDSYRGNRVIGTSYDFLSDAQPRTGQNFVFRSGVNFDAPLQAVLGFEVARRTGLNIGDQIQITHGLAEVAPGAEPHIHDNAPVTIVGILERSGTANDRVIFTDLYTTHALHDPSFHIEDYEDEHGTHDHAHDNEHEHDSEEPTDLRDVITLKELDALLVKMVDPAAALQLSGMINYPTPANPLLARNMMRDPFFRYKDQIMAVIPAMQIMALMSIVGNAEVVLKYIAWFVIVVALFGLLIAIYNTMEDRKRDIAIMRALGASKRHVFSIIVLEAITICAIGGIIGLFGGHAIVSLVTPHLAEVAGIVISSFDIQLSQLYYVLFVIVLGAIAGLIPAFKAYRTDAVRNLSSGK